MEQIDGLKKFGLIVSLMVGGAALFSTAAPTQAPQRASAAATPVPTSPIAGQAASPPLAAGASAAVPAVAEAKPAAQEITSVKLEGRWTCFLQFDKARKDADPLHEVDTSCVLHSKLGADGTFTGTLMLTPKRPPMGSIPFVMTKEGEGYLLKTERMRSSSWTLALQLKPTSVDEMSGIWTNENYGNEFPAKGRVTLKRVVLTKEPPAKLNGALKGVYTQFDDKLVNKHVVNMKIREEVSEDTYQGTMTGERVLNGAFGGIYDSKAGVFVVTTEHGQTLTLFHNDGGWDGSVDVNSDQGGPVHLAP